MRPRTVAEATLRAAEGRGLRESFCEFLDEFYACDDRGRQAALDAVPTLANDGFVDAYAAAVAEHLARRWGLAVPSWTARPGHFLLDRPVFMPDEPNLKGVLLVESPSAFRSRLIFTVAEPLRRARFPGRVTGCREIPDRLKAPDARPRRTRGAGASRP